jgi:hypothetical protein
MPAPLFYELHPFHLVLDQQLALLQWGGAVGRVVPELRRGRHVGECFRVRRCCARRLPLAGWRVAHARTAGVVLRTHTHSHTHTRTHTHTHTHARARGSASANQLAGWPTRGAQHPHDTATGQGAQLHAA